MEMRKVYGIVPEKNRFWQHFGLTCISASIALFSYLSFADTSSIDRKIQDISSSFVQSIDNFQNNAAAVSRTFSADMDSIDTKIVSAYNNADGMVIDAAKSVAGSFSVEPIVKIFRPNKPEIKNFVLEKTESKAELSVSSVTSGIEKSISSLVDNVVKTVQPAVIATPPAPIQIIPYNPPDTTAKPAPRPNIEHLYLDKRLEKAIQEKIKYYTGCVVHKKNNKKYPYCRIKGYSFLASESTRFDDFIYAGQTKTKYVDDSLIRSIGSNESLFKLNAVSDMGAEGPMQVMPDTAKKTMGVRVTQHFTESMFPSIFIESAKHLDNMAEKFGGNIMLALVGYNWHEDKAQKFYERYGDNAKFHEIYDKIPDETRSYLIDVLSLQRLLKNPDKYGLVINKRQLFSSMIDFVYIVRDGEHLRRIARDFDRPYSHVRDLNPQIRDPESIVPGMKIYMPKRGITPDLSYLYAALPGK